MKVATRTREFREGWLGRRRTYKCRTCLNKFQVDTLKPLPEKRRVCPECTDMQCPECGAEMEVLGWNPKCYLYVCPNVQCTRYRRPAKTISKFNPGEEAPELVIKPKVKKDVTEARKKKLKAKRKARKSARQKPLFIDDDADAAFLVGQL